MEEERRTMLLKPEEGGRVELTYTGVREETGKRRRKEKDRERMG